MKETPERVLDDLGRRMAELRRQRGLTQQDVAEQLGILVGDYQDIERGSRNCTVRTLVHVARSLGVPTRLLFDVPEAREPRRVGRPPTSLTVDVAARVGATPGKAGEKRKTTRKPKSRS